MRILYVDTPFIGRKGGDKNRSSLIWDILTENFSVDLLLITDKKNDFLMDDYSKAENIFEIQKKKCRKIFTPHSIMKFSSSEFHKLNEILSKNNCDIAFFRFCSAANFAKFIHKKYPRLNLIIDVDMLFSRISELLWKLNPARKNRFHFFEQFKLKRFEKKFFNLPFTFLFSNLSEKNMIEKRDLKKNSRARLKILPNMMKKVSASYTVSEKKYIIFFGALNSTVNKDTFNYVVNEIFPVCRRIMEKFDLEIRIVGKKPSQKQKEKIKNINSERIKLIGPVDDIQKYIGESLFVLLPVRIASGTLTRILESAALKKAVISSSVGAGGFELNNKEIIRADSPNEITEAIANFAENHDKRNEFGQNLYKKCLNLYSREKVAINLSEIIKNSKSSEA